MNTMKIASHHYFFLTAILLTALAGCKDDPPPPPEPPRTGQVIIGNQGASVGGTSTITVYNPADKSAEQNLFQKANTDRVGNGLYSMYVDGDRTFLVVSGEGEIIVMDTDSYKVKKRITGFGTPRHMLKITENKFYVTDAQENGLWVVNVNNGNLIRSITTGYSPTKMLLWKEMVFVANSGGAAGDSNMTVIHAIEDTLMRQVRVGHNPNSMVVDPENRLWVLCSGIEDQNPFASTPGVLISFDLTRDSLEYYIRDSLVVMDSLVYADNQLKPHNLILGPSGTELFFLDLAKDANLMRYNIGNANLPGNPFITGNFGHAAYDEIENEWYLSIPGDGTAPGQVARFDQGGGQTDLIESGIRPRTFGFK